MVRVKQPIAATSHSIYCVMIEVGPTLWADPIRVKMVVRHSPRKKVESININLSQKSQTKDGFPKLIVFPNRQETDALIPFL